MPSHHTCEQTGYEGPSMRGWVVWMVSVKDERLMIAVALIIADYLVRRRGGHPTGTSPFHSNHRYHPPAAKAINSNQIATNQQSAF